MKIKCNVPKIGKIKERVNNVINKIKANMDNKNNKKIKVPVRSYVLLFFMIIVGVFTLSINTKKYINSSKEKYTEYTLDKKEKVKEVSAIPMVYDTAISSISSNVSTEIEKEDNIQTTSSNIEYEWPVMGDIIKEYAMEKLVYSKTLGMWKTHSGIDIKAELGTKVKSMADGKVIDVSNSNFYGNIIKIEHEEGYVSLYGNLDENITIKKGKNIKRGEVIGKVGVSAAGEIADESHLHFEVMKNSKQINPTEILNVGE